MKKFSLLAETLPPKQSSCQMIITISTMESATPRPFDAALSCVYFFLILLLKRLLCSVYCFLCWSFAVPPVLTDRGLLSLRVATVTERRCDRRGDLTGTFTFLSVTETLTSVARSAQTTSVLFCVHSAAFASYLCVCACVCLPSVWGLQV